jgi:hypothetical protein
LPAANHRWILGLFFHFFPFLVRAAPAAKGRPNKIFGWAGARAKETFHFARECHLNSALFTFELV